MAVRTEDFQSVLPTPGLPPPPPPGPFPVEAEPIEPPAAPEAFGLDLQAQGDLPFGQRIDNTEVMVRGILDQSLRLRMSEIEALAEQKQFKQETEAQRFELEASQAETQANRIGREIRSLSLSVMGDPNLREVIRRDPTAANIYYRGLADLSKSRSTAIFQAQLANFEARRASDRPTGELSIEEQQLQASVETAREAVDFLRTFSQLHLQEADREVKQADAELKRADAAEKESETFRTEQFKDNRASEALERVRIIDELLSRPREPGENTISVGDTGFLGGAGDNSVGEFLGLGSRPTASIGELVRLRELNQLEFDRTLARADRLAPDVARALRTQPPDLAGGLLDERPPAAPGDGTVSLGALSPSQGVEGRIGPRALSPASRSGLLALTTAQKDEFRSRAPGLLGLTDDEIDRLLGGGR